MKSSRRLLAAGAAASVIVLTAIGGNATAASNCSQIAVKGYAMQQNLRASHILVECGAVPGGNPNKAYGSAGRAGAAPPQFAGTDVNTITGTETLPHVTQSESMIGVNGNDVVVNYNDSRAAAGGTQYSGVSVSHNGGTTFTRLGPPSPFASGHGSNFGDPIVVYNQKLGEFFAGDLSGGCGGQGIGLWTSTNGDTWATGACAVTETNADRESMAVDNNPSSPFYGRMYISWNDFNAGNASIKVTHSDDGTTWSSPVTLNPTGAFLRQVEITVGSDGSVFQAGIDEGGGGLSATEQNFMFKSTNGGAGFTSPTTAAIPGTFAIPGDSLCAGSNYFPKITPIWRQTGYGVPGVGPGGVVQYDYAVHGVGADPADVYYVRSTDNGATWGAPVKLNTDATTRAQWMPSLSVSPTGVVEATWYDRRNTSNNDYQRFARFSGDNGATWGPDQPLSTQVIPEPNQPDPNVQGCYAGDYNYPTATATTSYDSWTDGRVSISPNGPQQDVFFHAVPSVVRNLSVATAGSGAGSVTGSGISCPGVCSHTYADSAPVTLNATPAAGSTFAGWSGACSGTGSCSLTMDSDKSVTATFTAQRTLTVSTTGPGSGHISGPGIACGADCSEVYVDGTKVNLTAVAGGKSRFVGWSGVCSGKGSCAPTMNADKSVSAKFKFRKPDTEITKAKIKPKKRKAKFKFEATGKAKGFQCQLKRKHHKAKSFKKCTSPKKYKHLKPGKYTFKVRAKGPGGHDSTPAKKKFKIKR